MTYLDGYKKVLQKQINTQVVKAKKSAQLNYLFYKKSDKVYFQDCLIPDKAKLERAKPPVRMPTISQGGNPRSSEERVMQIAGDKNPIDWQIFRTYFIFLRNPGSQEIKDKSQGRYAAKIICKLSVICLHCPQQHILCEHPLR